MTRLLLSAGVLWLTSFWLAAPRAQAPVPAPLQAAHPAVGLFAHSEDCVACHNNLTAPTGEDASIGVAWRATMMANSARDPYWQAGVRRETLDHPRHRAAIEDECALCHMPMATRVSRAGGSPGAVFTHLPIGGVSAQQRLAADGVSCTVCHQIDPARLGTAQSFNGEFVVATPPAGLPRLIFGPYAIDAGRRTIMRSVTGFEQTEGAHIRQSELCATCHTLITTAYGPDGEVIGSLPEQMNFQEWQHSAFVRERSCQSCHMPLVRGPLRTASVLGEPRDTLSSHAFVGGNGFMLRMLNRYRADLGVEASPAELETMARATVRQLREDTATVAVGSPSAAGGMLAFDVDVRNLTGHKYPTGYPSRRTWLHVTVRDGAGRTVFESGRVEATGAIAGNDNDLDASRFEPHHAEIGDAGQVQIYEAILGDRLGVPTTGLLSATQYLKDNRLLPRGFDKATAGPQIGVFGGAATDGDFAGSGDRVHFLVTVAAAGPFTIDAELRYQSIGYRWAHTLERYDAPEPRRFVGYYTSMSAESSVVVATARALVP